MKLISIVNAVESLNMLGKMLLPAREAFKATKLLRDVSVHIDDYWKIKNRLLAQYGDTEDGKAYIIRKNEFETFKNELEALDNTEIEIFVDKIHLNGSTMISPNDLSSIESFIEIGE